MSTATPLATVLREHGHRATGSRRAVHAVLAMSSGHLSAEQVASLVDRDISLATVYRALAVLQAVGVARSVRLGEDGSASWELSHSDEHAHLVCTTCGDVDHHVGSAVAHLRDHLDNDHGFAASAVELLVSGTCSACRGVHDVVAPSSGA